jgi:hypothetical protein
MKRQASAGGIGPDACEVRRRSIDRAQSGDRADGAGERLARDQAQDLQACDRSWRPCFRKAPCVVVGNRTRGAALPDCVGEMLQPVKRCVTDRGSELICADSTQEAMLRTDRQSCGSRRRIPRTRTM